MFNISNCFIMIFKYYLSISFGGGTAALGHRVNLRIFACGTGIIISSCTGIATALNHLGVEPSTNHRNCWIITWFVSITVCASVWSQKNCPYGVWEDLGSIWVKEQKKKENAENLRRHFLDYEIRFFIKLLNSD